MSITLTYTGGIRNFQEAYQCANNILQSDAFITMISARPQPYDECQPSDLSPRLIAQFFRDSDLVLNLRHYSRPASIGGAFDPRYPTVIWVNINTTRIGCIYAAVLIHECVHALSYHTPNADFSHDTDGPTPNRNTAPYAIQRATRETFCAEKEIDPEKDLIPVELKVNKEDIVNETTC